jgi:hypothetical protein
VADSPRLDWTDARAVMAWLGAVRVALDDAHGVTLDMLRTSRRRALGHREHARLHKEAREKLAQLLDHATPGEPDGGAEPEAEPRDPSGAGASPIH